jgi:DNA-binding response OmpR family regulator
MAIDNQYDLIISDLMMPIMDGIELVKEIRKNKILSPILILTVRDSIKDKVIGLDCGADDYLTKPFSFDELTARVRALLRRNETTKENILSVGALKLDLVSHKASVSDIEINLTPKEFAILEYLLRNKNRVISRTKLVEHVYDLNFDSGTNVIDVYINKLRNKISNEKGDDFIKTIRGIGYVIKD